MNAASAIVTRGLSSAAVLLAVCALVALWRPLERVALWASWAALWLAVTVRWHVAASDRTHRSGWWGGSGERRWARHAARCVEDEWVNDLFRKLWNTNSQSISRFLRGKLAVTLNRRRPTYIDLIQIPQFVLGRRPPRVSNIRAFVTNSERDVQFEFDVSYTGEMYMVLVLRFGSRRDDDAEAEDDLGVRLGDGISAEAKTGSEPHRRAARAEMAERPTSTSGTAPSSMPWRRYIPTARVPLLIRDIEFQARCYAHFELEPGRKSLCRAMELALVGIPNLLDLRVQPLATLHWMDIPALSGFLRRYLIERVASRFLYPQCARFDFGAAGDAHAEAVPSGHGEGGAANAAQHPAPATRTTPLLLADAAGACRYGGILTVRIVSARGLRAPHSMGDAIDAFVIVYLGSRRKRTRVVRDTASPTWNATFEFFIDDPASAPPVLCCYVFDARLRAVRRSNSEASARAESAFLGSCDVPIGPCLASEQRLDRWLELEEAVAGKLHVTLAFAAFTGGEERFFDAPVRPSTMVAGAAATTSATMPPAPPAPPTALNAAPLRRAPSHGQVSDADLFARAAASSLTAVAAATRPIDREPSLPRSLPATSHAAGTREPTSVDELNAWLAGWLDGTLDTAQPCMNPVSTT
ncbi:hypothetical protein CDCA_CDCA11G3218 [Cyanidium caldarium]|uniref:C2 domain-containing protein n=1 Tax=Cyanidium caldarium TaxID=2771 RepID=A0AAV9IY03_CYACA|nr:hypothetical protein CDCA_CDCA11G3218 [Cyanidium caldarium]